MNPIFAVYFLKGKEIKMLIWNTIITILLYLFILGSIGILEYIGYLRTRNWTLNFREDFLEIFFDSSKKKKIFYNEIEMIFIAKNILGSYDILINFPTNNIIHNLGSKMLDDKKSIALNNVKNYKNIKNKLIEKMNFKEILSEKKILETKITFYYLFSYIIFIIYVLWIFYKIKIAIFLVLIIFIRLKSREYSYFETNYGIKIFSYKKELYLKEGNYEINNNKLKIKIKNSDTLIEKQILIPNKFKICESVQNFM
ncbi:hypothetical protein AXF11_01660 [Leptotrichia sp. oral taxon 847]|nr:hypothetical protein AXF11_01660 [Leptotrichia sp. oral taxon 847]